MVKIIWLSSAFIIIATARFYDNRHYDFRRLISGETQVTCSPSHAKERDMIIEQANCGTPKAVYEKFGHGAHELVSPEGAWVKKCIGTCEYDNGGECVSTSADVKKIPVRIYSVKTDKEACATYPVVEHTGCACIALRRKSNGTLPYFKNRI